MNAPLGFGPLVFKFETEMKGEKESETKQRKKNGLQLMPLLALVRPGKKKGDRKKRAEEKSRNKQKQKKLKDRNSEASVGEEIDESLEQEPSNGSGSHGGAIGEKIINMEKEEPVNSSSYSYLIITLSLIYNGHDGVIKHWDMSSKECHVEPK